MTIIQAVAGIGQPADPNFKNVALLLKDNGTNGAQNNTFLDSSSNNFTITRNGDTTQGAFTPYVPNGYWSNYFDGSGDSLTVPAGSAFAYGTGDFTVDGWFNCPSVVAYFSIIFSQTVSGTNYFVCGLGDGTNAIVKKVCFTFATSGGGTTVVSGSTEFAFNTWNHFAIVRSSGVVTCYLNGVGGTPVNCTQDFSNTTYVPTIGRYTHTEGLNFTGYLSNLRVIKGTAVYTTNFTPPTAPLTAVTNTSLLTCQSNRFIDNSSNAFAITRNGDTRVTAFQPFPKTSIYSPTAYGGSGYFDGTGDYLSIADNAALDLESSDFTIELWAYYLAVGGVNGRGTISKGTTTGASILIFQGGTNELAFYASSNGTSWDISSNQQFSSNIPLNTWHHIAVTRSGNTFRLFLNGTLSTSFTSALSLINNSASVDIGTYGSFAVNAYISNLRIVKGTAVYTANFTPPASPVTNITNTSLLCNFTNAGIFDATTINDLQTVGNAQVSTTQAKWGATSLYFDGTGDRLVAPPSENINLASGDFTVEAWVYTTTIAAGDAVACYRGASNASTATDLQWAFYRSGSTMIVRPYQSTTDYSINIGTIAANTWYHVALTRSGNTFSGFLNGIVATTKTISGALNNNAVWYGVILGYMTVSGVDASWNGYVQDLRITRGIARYTANFTPPVAPFPPI